MLKVTGEVINIFTVSAGLDKDGNEYPERHKVQLLGDVVLENGDVQKDLLDLKIDDLSVWADLKGKNISVDVGAFAPSKGNVILTVKKGAKPEIIKGLVI